MCQPSFTYSNASIQVIFKPGKQQLIGSTSVKKQSFSIHKNMVETIEKARKMLVKSLDKMCMTNLEIEEKQLKYYKQWDMKQSWFTRTWCKPSLALHKVMGMAFVKPNATTSNNDNGDPDFDPKLGDNNKIAFNDE